MDLLLMHKRIIFHEKYFHLPPKLPLNRPEFIISSQISEAKTLK